MSLLVKEKKRIPPDDESVLSFSDKIKLLLNNETLHPNEVFEGLLDSDIKVVSNWSIINKHGGYLNLISPTERKIFSPVYYKATNDPDNKGVICYRPYSIKNEHIEKYAVITKENISKNVDSKNFLFTKSEKTHFNREKKSPLSNEFKVATEIYRCELEGKLVWYTKLVSLLKDEMSKNTVTKALNVLFDWGIVKSEFGETEKGRPGKLLKITNDSKATISDLFNKYWKEYRSY